MKYDIRNTIYASYQKGFANLAVLLLLIIGIGFGTYLVQQQTDFLPKAAGRTTACDGQTLAGQSTKSKADFRAIYCSNANTTCAKADEEWVVQHENELKQKGTPCSGGGTSPASSSTTSTGTQPKPQSSSSSSSGTASEDQKACLATLDDSYYDSKVGTRLAQYYAIMEGVPSLCVKADLGLEPHLTAKPSGGTTQERLFLCSGAGSTKQKLDLTWRVDSAAEGGQLREIDPTDKAKLSLDPANLPNKEHVKKAEGMLK